jgi:hypothetical protein
MTYSVTGRWGDSEDAPNERRMRELLAQLEEHDPEHPDAWLTHESGWILAVFESGLVVLENLESEGNPRHQVGISREKALSLWLKLSRGDIAEIEQEPWSPGHSPPLSPEERVEIARKAEESTLASFRTFYDKLGPENAEVSCRHVGCRRGAVRNSVLCRVHHFESIYNRPCPFHD